MSVHFILGRAGSGKSLHCFRAIVEMLKSDPLGPAIYWIVPKQETFSAERELACNSGLGGFCRVRVVSFELLGEEILAECGGTAIPQVTPIGRQVIIGHLLRKSEKQLVHYASAARQVGLAAELDKMFAELERSGKTAADVGSLINELQNATETSSLANKLSDLRLLYEQYITYLGQERLDPHRRLAQVLESLDGCKRIRDAVVFVDGFLEFTDYERKMLVGLAKSARDVQITMLLDPKSPVLKNPHLLPDDLSLFYKTELAYRNLWFAFHEAGVEPGPPIALNDSSRFRSAPLKHIERELFSATRKDEDARDTITLIEAPDRRSEVDAAARKIQDYLQAGLRLRDVAVLMRSMDDYLELIDASFTEHGLKYFADRRRTAGHHPLIQFTRAALEIALHGWPHEAVMTLLKTELAGLSRDEVDELENYVLLHRIRGSMWADSSPWAYRRKLTRKTQDDELPSAVPIETQRMDALRRKVSEKLLPLMQLFASDDAITVKQFIVELFNVFERFSVRVTLQGWIKNATDQSNLEEAKEHQQVWTELTALLDQMVDVVGDEPVSGKDFVDVLDTGLDAFDLALTPPTVDQVLVGSVDRSRSGRPRAVILLGMNDSQFPRLPHEDSILSDSERQTLQQHRLDLNPDTERTLLDERLLGYIAFTRASEFLCLTRSIADEESRPQAPSPFWIRLRELFPSLQPVQIPRESKTKLEYIGTPRQLVTALAHWVRHEDDAIADDSWKYLYNWLATHDCCSDAIDIMRYRAWKALRYRNDSNLSEETAQKLFKSPLTASISQIETFAACPFKHFLTYGLRLSEREDQDVTAVDLGNVCHGILERIVRQMLKDKSGWENPSPTVVRELAQEIGKELRGELMLSSARNQYILKHIEKTIGQVMAAQTTAGKRGRFTPWRAELQFGDGREIPALKLNTPQGRELRLQGKIDRVDWVESEAAYAVIDYKYRGDSLSLDWVYHGLSLQLLTYLLVLQNSGVQQGFTPVAAFYVQLLRQLEKVNHPDDATPADDPTFDLNIKPRGIIDYAHRNLVDPDLTTKASDLVRLYTKTDGTLGNKNNSDGCESFEFAAVLKHVERKLAELADRIVNGQITVSPYRIGQASPCSSCQYHTVCRFDVKLNEYQFLTPMKREDVLKRVVEESPE